MKKVAHRKPLETSTIVFFLFFIDFICRILTLRLCYSFWEEFQQPEIEQFFRLKLNLKNLEHYHRSRIKLKAV